MAMNFEVPLTGNIKNLIFEKDIDKIDWSKIDSNKMLSDYDYNIQMLMKHLTRYRFHLFLDAN